MKKLKLAIIGQGRSGRNIHGAFLKTERNERWEVAAVVEQDAFRRQRALEEYPGIAVYESVEQLLSRKDLDLVVNASYSRQHYPVTKLLLENGFNVLVEKPFGRNYYECCELIKLAKDKGLVLDCFQQSFFAPFFVETKKVIESGKLGDIKQVSIRYNGLARRWDWQTLQCEMAGSVYNTGPHPLGFALDFLDFDKDARVIYSNIDCCLTSGDAEDYAKILLTAPGKPVIDVEISAMDAYSDYTLKLQGTRGTYKCTTSSYKMKYFIDEENEPRPVIRESLSDENGYPIYCGEKLNFHEEAGDFTGSAFDTAVQKFYEMMYDAIVCGKELIVKPEHAARIINVIEAVHAENPMEIRF